MSSENQDLALSPVDGDLYFVGGDLTFDSGITAVASHVKARLRLFKGEHFADLSAGVPYYQAVLLKNPSLDAITAVLRKTVEDTEGIDTVSSFAVTYSPSARSLTVAFRATTALGELTEQNGGTVVISP